MKEEMMVEPNKPTQAPVKDHATAEAGVRVFNYEPPSKMPGTRGIVKLCQSKYLRGMVHVVKEGGEATLHYHTERDALYMVLKGRVKFYGPGDELIGEFGPHDGVLIPADARYWFETVSEEPLELMQVCAYHHNSDTTERIDLIPQHAKATVRTSVERVPD
jgi:mannose-6-phosphate isomerase-like protein (cupin superfamily)